MGQWAAHVVALLTAAAEDHQQLLHQPSVCTLLLLHAPFHWLVNLGGLQACWQQGGGLCCAATLGQERSTGMPSAGEAAG